MRSGQKAIVKMDVNKKQSKVATKSDGKKLLNFFKDVKQELGRVEWTSKDELKVYVKIVLVSTFCFAMGVYLVDLAIRGVLGGINMLFG